MAVQSLEDISLDAEIRYLQLFGNFPRGVATDAGGFLYVGTEKYGDRPGTLNIHDNTFNLLGSAPVSDPVYTGVSFVAVRPGGQAVGCNPTRTPWARLFVFETSDPQNPFLLNTVNIPGTDDLGGRECRGVAFDAQGQLWVAAFQRLIKLRLDWVGNPTNAEYFSPGGNPHGLAIHPSDGRIFYAAYNANFVGVLDPASPAQRAATIVNVCDDWVWSPMDITFTPRGDLFVGCGNYEGATTDLVVVPSASLQSLEGTIDMASLGSRKFAYSEIIGGGYLAWLTTTVAVPIDIKPGNDLNVINLGSNGVLPVAILSDPGLGFDATTVDPTTVTLSGTTVRLRGNGTPMTTFKDVNGDGYTDLVVQVSTETFELSETATEAVLEAETLDGRRIRGADTVTIVP